MPTEVKELLPGGRLTLIFEQRGPKWVIVHEHASWKPPDIEPPDPHREKPAQGIKKPL